MEKIDKLRLEDNSCSRLDLADGFKKVVEKFGGEVSVEQGKDWEEYCDL
jgi:predicted SpoU family rRNA methylase